MRPIGPRPRNFTLDGACFQDLLARAADALQAHDGPCTEPPPHQHLRSAGIASINLSGALTIREPKNHFGGYEWTFAKGRIESGETSALTAARELTEETGYTAQIVAFIGDYQGDTGIARMYLGRQTGGALALSDETESVEIVDPLTAYGRFNRKRDKRIRRDLLQLAASAVSWEWTINGERYLCRLVDGVTIQAEYV
jgi:8-oxo-dGTP pyrophosphatase MutT (NUDIX family)